MIGGGRTCLPLLSRLPVVSGRRPKRRGPCDIKAWANGCGPWWVTQKSLDRSHRRIWGLWVGFRSRVAKRPLEVGPRKWRLKGEPGKAMPARIHRLRACSYAPRSQRLTWCPAWVLGPGRVNDGGPGGPESRRLRVRALFFVWPDSEVSLEKRWNRAGRFGPGEAREKGVFSSPVSPRAEGRGRSGLSLLSGRDPQSPRSYALSRTEAALTRSRAPPPPFRASTRPGPPRAPRPRAAPISPAPLPRSPRRHRERSPEMDITGGALTGHGNFY